MIIAIDGPAGSGKSTIALGVARRLGLAYLDTGAMYRAVTLIALERGVPLEDGDALGAVATRMPLHFEAVAREEAPRVYVGERDVSEAIRSPEVSRAVSQVAAHPSVRQCLTVRQRGLAGDGDIVLEGRDIGTVVCPNADIKVFLTASVEERARRRGYQLQEQGVDVELYSLQRELQVRDGYDSGRAVAPLQRADDALEIDTTTLPADEVIDLICETAARPGGEGRSPC
jgi:cytidylate kinase